MNFLDNKINLVVNGDCVNFNNGKVIIKKEDINKVKIELEENRGSLIPPLPSSRWGWQYWILFRFIKRDGSVYSYGFGADRAIEFCNKLKSFNYPVSDENLDDFVRQYKQNKKENKEDFGTSIKSIVFWLVLIGVITLGVYLGFKYGFIK